MASAAASLRCNTYIGTDFSGSGAGVETCIPVVKACVMRQFYVVGVRTYTMSCDDLFQCVAYPPNTCCTQDIHNGSLVDVISCSTTNFNHSSANSTSFPPECQKKCSSSVRENGVQSA